MKQIREGGAAVNVIRFGLAQATMLLTIFCCRSPQMKQIDDNTDKELPLGPHGSARTQQQVCWLFLACMCVVL